jgi:hypothetical protein
MEHISSAPFDRKSGGLHSLPERRGGSKSRASEFHAVYNDHGCLNATNKLRSGYKMRENELL